MPYGEIRVDTITFTNGGVDKSITVSGLFASTSGNLTVTGTVSGVTATFATGTFSSQVSGLTVIGTTGTFTSLTGTTVTGANANFVSGIFTNQISGATVTGTTANFTSGNFTSISGGTCTVTSGVFASGTATNPSISFVSDPNTGIYSPGADQVALSTNSNERARIDSSGRLGLGTSSPKSLLHVAGDHSNIANSYIASNLYFDGAWKYINNGYAAAFKLANSAGFVSFETAPQNTGGADASATLSTRLVITPTGNVGIGTTSPSQLLHSQVSSANTVFLGSHNNTGVDLYTNDSTGEARLTAKRLGGSGSKFLSFYTDTGSAEAERARIDSSGRLLVGTSSNRTSAAFQIEGTTFGTSLGTITNNSANTSPAYFQLIKSRGTSVGSQALVSNGDGLGNFQFIGTDGTQQLVAAAIEGVVDGTPGANDMPGRLVFSTTADGAASPAERMRITSEGFVLVGKTSTDINVAGSLINSVGTAGFTRDSDIGLFVGRNTNDGGLVVFRQDGTDEGSISVSGTTVSYNGAHLSRWSQLPGGATREEILRGTVLSNIDEMCDWGEEENEQLNRMKVSDVEGDPNVSGVFQDWDDDDDTYTDDFYCAMTGDFIIRIAEGVTVQRGDLLMSAGDGTAKPQDDDIIRSKTVAKVTSTHVTCTYDDGSYCVPCVLMAC
jgi:hypothetical protein